MLVRARQVYPDASPRYAEVVRRIAQECRIVGRDGFVHDELGHLNPPRDLEVDAEFPVLRHLWRVIYLHYYAGDAVATRLFLDGGRAVAAIPDHEDFALVESYEREHRCQGHWTPGWLADDRTDGTLRLSKDGVTLLARRDQVRAAEDGTAALRMPAARRYRVMGWYTVVGDHGPVDRSEPVIRLYVTLSGPSAATRVLRSLTGTLIDLGVPFQYKLVNHPDAFQRRDNSVLYLHRDLWLGRARESVLAALADGGVGLRDDPPCFAGHVAPGVSFAVEPRTGTSITSFGEHRCLLVAKGLVAAYVAGDQSPDGQVAAVRAEFDREGLCLDRPFLDGDAA